MNHQKHVLWWKGEQMNDPRNIRFDGEKYPVLEIFTSIQSEGARAGTITHFLRLAGCNLDCSFCDTPMEPYKLMTVDEIVAKLKRSEKNKPTGRRVVITGGEPFVHDMEPLLNGLKGKRGPGFYIAIESNGTLLEKWLNQKPGIFDDIDWLTVSPKKLARNMEREVRIYRSWANEVKYVVPDHENLIDPLHPQIFVQPEYNNPEAVGRCLEWMSKHPSIRLSVQIHKFIGLR